MVLIKVRFKRVPRSHRRTGKPVLEHDLTGAGRVLARSASGEENGSPCFRCPPQELAESLRIGTVRDPSRKVGLRLNHLLHDPGRAFTKLRLRRHVRSLRPKSYPLPRFMRRAGGVAR